MTPSYCLFLPGASPLWPTATIAQTCSRALSCNFVLSWLIFQGPTSSGSILTKAACGPEWAEPAL